MNTGSTSPVMDICIICAIPVEAKALLRVLEKEGTEPIKQGFSIDGRAYKYKTIRNAAGESLRVQVSWLPRYGPSETTMHLGTFLREFKPRFAAMTGICAGDRQEVHRGDLIVAERAFFYDTGKIVIDQQKNQQHHFDTYTVQPASQIVQYARMFDGWESSVAGVSRPGTERNRKRTPPSCHVVPLASSSAVHADNPFAEIRVPIRSAIALDMEGAAFYRAMENFPHIRFLLVKGVSDYADSEKDDSYQDYASEVSARYMLAFIKEYVNQRLMPGAYSEPASKQKKATPVMSARPAKVAEVAKPAGVQSIMYIYAPEDEKFCTELEKYLNPLRRERLLWSYYDQSIRPGELTQEKIEQRLHDADIILPIITPDLMNNQQIYDQLELAWQERARGAKFIPIIVKRVDGWEQSKFHKLMSLPRDQRLIPINSVSKRDQALYDIAKEIRAIVTK